MGVSGCGKTTIARRLSEFYKVPFVEGDDYHSDSNKAKMKSGIPLTDADRKPWLEALAAKMASLHDKGYVVACSALKKKYHAILCGNGGNNYITIWLDGEKEIIRNRLENRNGHYMPASLLDSQYDVLEVPEAAIRIDIGLSPEEQIKTIANLLSERNRMNKSESKNLSKVKGDIGIIGLGVMGKALARNFSSRGYKVAVYNAPLPGEEHVAAEFVKAWPEDNFIFNDSLKEFADHLDKPKKVLLMIKAGEPVDEMIDQLSPLMEAGDIVIDAGNSYYKDTVRRARHCNGLGFSFVGMGVSGGEEGALKGPAIMPAGDESAKMALMPLLKNIAAQADGHPCVRWVATDGAGHFVKMIHNGIEYADMQLLSEVYGIYKYGYQYDNETIVKNLNDWKNSAHNSYLLDITIDIIKKKVAGMYVLDTILDVAGHKGTGLWTSEESLKLGVAAPSIISAMQQRIVSSEKALRESFPDPGKSDWKMPYHKTVKNGFLFCRMIALIEGFHIIIKAAKQYHWNINLNDVVAIWRGGCIIRSDILVIIREALKEGHQINHLMDSEHIRIFLEELYPDAIKLAMAVVPLRLSTPGIHAAINYYKSITSPTLPVNMIQAQRDYFGAHTYRRVDDRETPVHTDWQ
jgi:6-phosphogluconate dehydrogenase